VAGIGKQRTVRGKQPFDLLGGAVEACRHRRDLVAAAHGNACVESAFTPAIHASPQCFEAAREMAHDRIGGEPDHRGDQRKISKRAAAARTERHSHPRRDYASVRLPADQQVMPAWTYPSPGTDIFWRNRPAGRGEQPTPRPVDGDIGIESRREPLDGRLQQCGVGIGRQHRLDEGVAPAAPAGMLAFLADAHEDGAGNRHDREAGQHGQIDLDEKAAAHR
jgi:hypothetical protein